uniref:Uncharacterized protein n=1 Tax=Arundo donax TaxID=35708 RepID=A0A0A8Z992_ARUDO
MVTRDFCEFSIIQMLYCKKNGILIHAICIEFSSSKYFLSSLVIP